MKNQKYGFITVLLSIVVLIFLVVQAFGAPSDLFTNSNQTSGTQIQRKPLPGPGDPPIQRIQLCQNPGSPFGQPYIEGQTLFGFQGGRFGRWTATNSFTPINTFGGDVTPTAINGYVSMEIYLRECVKEVQVREGAHMGLTDGYVVRASESPNGRKISFKGLLLDSTLAKTWCNSFSRPRVPGSTSMPPILDYDIPKSLHSTTIMKSGGPYSHERAFGVSLKLQCYKE